MDYCNFDTENNCVFIDLIFLWVKKGVCWGSGTERERGNELNLFDRKLQ
jgi:hypothetical protein